MEYVLEYLRLNYNRNQIAKLLAGTTTKARIVMSCRGVGFDFTTVYKAILKNTEPKNRIPVEYHAVL